MPDISMCQDEQCPSRETCYRFKAKPDLLMQAYGHFGREDGAERCGYYWPLKSPADKHRLDKTHDF